MGSTSQVLAVGVRPPIAGEVYTHDITDAVIVRAIPDAWQGQIVAWTVDGGSCSLAFGASESIATAIAARATGTPPDNVANAASGYHYGDGASSFAEIRKSLGLTHYAVVGAASAGTIRLARSSYAPNAT